MKYVASTVWERKDEGTGDDKTGAVGWSHSWYATATELLSVGKRFTCAV